MFKRIKEKFASFQLAFLYTLKLRSMQGIMEAKHCILLTLISHNTVKHKVAVVCEKIAFQKGFLGFFPFHCDRKIKS